MPSDRSWVGSASPARLEVRLLGAVEVILDGRRLGAFNSLRLQRFLALIALRRDRQHRSRLAFELWPDSDERQARTNLRKPLHDLRHSLEQKADLLLGMAHAMSSAVQAVDLACGIAGTSAFRATNPLERCFRDVQTTRHHVFASDQRYGTLGQVYLGVPPDFPVVAF
jgi:DNA-binding SARP family transcriptional activator